MIGPRSARARAILAGTVLVLLLVGMGALAVWRTHEDEQSLETLDHTSSAATALEGAQAGFWQAQGALSALVISGDPAWVDDYDSAFAEAKQKLADARAEFLAMGKTAEVSALDALTKRIGEFNGSVRPLFPVIIEGDRQAVVELANARMPELTATNTAIIADLQGMVREEQQEAAAGRQAAERGAGVTLWLLLGLGCVALATGVGAVVMLVGWVVGPLATLRASARAIASGDFEARARVSGPEEVSSLARDFNEMTDALAAKTQALQQSEKRYRLLAENASDIIWTMDMNLRFTYESPSVTRIRGFSPEEALAQTIEETLTPVSLEVAERALAEELAPEAMTTKDLSRSRTLELEHTCKDGSTVWLEVTTTFLRDEDGRAVGMLGASRDISERKRAEEQLEESRRLLENVTQGIAEGILLLSKDLEILWANNAILEETGREIAQVLGKRCYEITHRRESPCDDRLNRCPVHEAQKTGQPVTVTHAHFDAAGMEHVTEVAAYPVRDEKGDIVQFVHVSRDVTERKRAEEALRESEEAFRLLFENAKDAVFWADPETGLITRCNKAAETLLERKSDEIIGQPQAALHPPQKAEAYAEMFKRHIEQQGFVEDEAEVITKSGETKLVLITASLTLVRGTHIIQGVFRDITERKRAEDEQERLHAQLKVRAITDGLTGLYNHAHFFQRLSEETERSGRYNHGFAVAMMDVDNFKRFNDSHGHQAGDEMLRLIADSIRSGLRRSDLAFRYGGDEFAALLLNADAARAQAVIDRINRRLAKSLEQMNDGPAARLSLSAGVACFAVDGKTPDELVRAADAALYSAKWAAQARYAKGDEYAIESPAPSPATLETGTLSSAASSLATALRELGVPDALAELNLRIIAALGTLAEIKDPYIRGHQERTSDEAATLAEEMGLSRDRVRGTRLAALLHDLGKAGVSGRILSKPGKLTQEEFAEIKEHSPLGSMMIISEVGALQQLVPIVRHHHERFDGKGYPDGLSGQDIPLEARILAVVDAFDAMTHERAYRKAMSREEALAELERGAGTQFDPAVVEVFLAWVNRESENVPAPPQPTSEDNELAMVRTT